MFKLNSLTDFEKLLYANEYIKELKSEISKLNIELGVKKSELDEVKYKSQQEISKLKKLLKQENPDLSQLNTYKTELNATQEKLKKENKYKDMYHRVFSELIRLKNNKTPIR